MHKYLADICKVFSILGLQNDTFSKTQGSIQGSVTLT